LANITSQNSASVNVIDKTSGAARLIYLSRITQKKNLHLALLALKNIPAGSSVVYDVYGPIEDVAYWTKCLQIVDTLPSNVKFYYRGVLSHDSVIVVLKKYHSLLLPTANENYGHAIVEAMLNGVVPIISDQTPWRNLEKNSAGWDVDLANADNLSLAINDLIMADSTQYRKYSKGANEYISKSLDISSLLNGYRKLFSG
jgi:glycosyltransferase involved in cell wall biosynthesis